MNRSTNNSHSASQKTIGNNQPLLPASEDANDLSNAQMKAMRDDRLYTEENTVGNLDENDLELVNIVSSEDSVSDLSSVSLRIDSKNSV